MTSKLIVIDTNVCLDLFVFLDPRWAKLSNDLKNGNIKAITREDCRNEWLAVLKYPHLPIKPESMEQIIATFDSCIEVVAPELKTMPLPRCSDKDDQKFLEIARDANANALITKDKALLKLARKLQQLGYYSIQTPEKYISALI